MINAYSVVWLPVSGSNWRDAVCATRDRVLVGMTAPSGCGDDGVGLVQRWVGLNDQRRASGHERTSRAGLRGQGTEGAGDRGDDGEQDEGGEEAKDQGEGEPDGGLARCGLGL